MNEREPPKIQNPEIETQKTNKNEKPCFENLPNGRYYQPIKVN